MRVLDVLCIVSCMSVCDMPFSHSRPMWSIVAPTPPNLRKGNVDASLDCEECCPVYVLAVCAQVANVWTSVCLSERVSVYVSAEGAVVLRRVCARVPAGCQRL